MMFQKSQMKRYRFGVNREELELSVLWLQGNSAEKSTINWDVGGIVGWRYKQDPDATAQTETLTQSLEEGLFVHNVDNETKPRS